MAVGVAVGFSSDEDESPGPLHMNVFAEPPGFAVSVTVPPLQM